MRELELEEIRNIQLDILKEVSDFCDENNLTYFLCGGTLLGAIRHEGYIPWDDDIDIMMPKPDYERLIEGFKSEDLKLYNHNSIKGYNNPFVKISDTKTKAIGRGIKDYEIGVNIDVFPLDGFPNSSILTSLHINRVKIYRSLMKAEYITSKKDQSIIKSFIAFISKITLQFVSKKVLLEKITQVSKKYRFEYSRFAGILVWGYGKREVCPKSVFNKQIDVLFEGNYFKGPEDYDTYLTNVYGDYMKLPPVEKRQSSHKVKYFINSI